MSRQLNFMPRYAGAPDAGNPVSPPRAIVEGWARAARARRSAEASQADYRARHLLEGLGRLRIAGRHSAAAVSASTLDAAFKEYGVPAEQGRAAYEAGQRDRARGVPCMCNRCAGRAVDRGIARPQEGTR
jgi:hypothetical protein